MIGLRYVVLDDWGDEEDLPGSVGLFETRLAEGGAAAKDRCSEIQGPVLGFKVGLQLGSGNSFSLNFMSRILEFSRNAGQLK